MRRKRTSGEKRYASLPKLCYAWAQSLVPVVESPEEDALAREVKDRVNATAAARIDAGLVVLAGIVVTPESDAVIVCACVDISCGIVLCEPRRDGGLQLVMNFLAEDGANGFEIRDRGGGGGHEITLSSPPPSFTQRSLHLRYCAVAVHNVYTVYGLHNYDLGRRAFRKAFRQSLR